MTTLHLQTAAGKEALQHSLEEFPLGTDISLMLFAGFGLLMTFLKVNLFIS